MERRQEGLMEGKKHVEKYLEDKSRMRGDKASLNDGGCIFWHVSERIRKRNLVKIGSFGMKPQVSFIECSEEAPKAEECGSFSAHM